MGNLAIVTDISRVVVASCSFRQELAVVTDGMDERPKNGLTVQETKKGARSYDDHSGETINRGLILQGGLAGLPAGRRSISADSRIFGACKVLERVTGGKADQIGIWLVQEQESLATARFMCICTVLFK